MIAAAIMGDPNASIPNPQPNTTALCSVPSPSHDGELSNVREPSARQRGESLGLAKRLLPVSNTRKIGKHSMMLNDATPRMEVDPETYESTCRWPFADV